MNAHHLRSGTMLLVRATPSARPGTATILLFSQIPVRYASSQSSTTVARKEEEIAKLSRSDKVNAPRSSIPAPIDLPVKGASDSTIGHLFRTGKAYLGFFKSGLGSILANYKATRPIQGLADQNDGTLTTLVERGLITRSQFQHLMRARHDIIRVPLFGVIFLVFGETSPFILPFIPNTVPHPCRVPAQLTRQRRKAAEARAAAYEASGSETAVVLSKGLDQLDSTELALVAKVLRLDSPRFLPLPLLWRWRVHRHVEYLQLDSILLERGGGVDMIDSGEELLMAAEERGINTHGRPEDEVRASLRDWEKVVQAVGGVNAGAWLVKPESWGKVVEKL
jgi:hypothetical protein